MSLRSDEDNPCVSVRTASYARTVLPVYRATARLSPAFPSSLRKRPSFHPHKRLPSSAWAHRCATRPMACRVLAAAATLAASLPGASSLFSTTLHGAPTEVVEPGTPGVATMELQPWLTTVDPAARALARRRLSSVHARSRGSCDAARTREATLCVQRARRPRMRRGRGLARGVTPCFRAARAAVLLCWRCACSHSLLRRRCATMAHRRAIISKRVRQFAASLRNAAPWPWGRLLARTPVAVASVWAACSDCVGRH